MRIERILCAVDFSEPSRVALRMAAEMALKFDAALTLLHVYQVPIYPLPDGVVVPTTLSVTDLLAEVERALVDWRGEAEQLGVRRVKAISVEGLPWREIVAQAAEGTFDLLVVGTHGHSGIKHLLLGSVAERVVRHAPCPVLAVRPLPHGAPAKQ